jgi:hypothetical protein
LKYTYSRATRRLVFAGKKSTFNKIHIDTSQSNTGLCELGARYVSNKSTMSLAGHRSGFTAIYTLLFTGMRDMCLNFSEISIELNASTKMWRSFFSKASIYGFEYDEDKIQNAEQHGLKDTYYYKMDVRSADSISDGFRHAGVIFDIIIDDSTHQFEDQIRIIDVCKDYLKEGGVLIIEDIYRKRNQYSEHHYYKALESIKAYFSDITFIESSHVNNFSGRCKSDKLLLLVRNRKMT